ncbi:IS3 family transposase [Chitinimonas sp. BJB300]|uniref:IS3 family transposase n=2 Tax=Chitinimonas sp. BJB300 TaxID=1559339 RepID=UPI0011828ED2|nr:IS3 family transposase [Chitinimonas sp. BJB300]TSJ91200.1 IS3 family transposase [Chitinimonas sp. BJB300]
MKKTTPFSPEVRERAVRMVQEHRADYPSLWAAVTSFAPKIGCSPSTLHEWVKHSEINHGVRDGITRDERERLKALEREVKALRRANEILKVASAFFGPGGARPPTQEMMLLIDQQRANFGVEPICQVLQMAPSAYWRYAARQKNPALLPERIRRDQALIPQIERVWQANMCVYGADKVWCQLKREGTVVARCTVERLMRFLGLHGARRGKRVKTTVPDAKDHCPQDRVHRCFKADRPNALWVADYTYVSTWQGGLYVAFVIDVFARRIVGWRVSRSMRTDFVLDALEQALYARQPKQQDGLIHHSDRGSQYLSIRYTERLSEAGIEPSVGSRGDSYDNALAETINDLYKAEVIHRLGPWKTGEAVELATLEWVAWFNHHRLLEPIGYIPPAEAEANYYQQLAKTL